MLFITVLFPSLAFLNQALCNSNSVTPSFIVSSRLCLELFYPLHLLIFSSRFGILICKYLCFIPPFWSFSISFYFLPFNEHKASSFWIRQSSIVVTEHNHVRHHLPRIAVKLWRSANSRTITLVTLSFKVMLWIVQRYLRWNVSRVFSSEGHAKDPKTSVLITHIRLMLIFVFLIHFLISPCSFCYPAQRCYCGHSNSNIDFISKGPQDVDGRTQMAIVVFYKFLF